MSLLTSASAVNSGNNIWATLPLPSTITSRVLNTSTINANTIICSSTFVNNINADYSETTEAFIYDKLTLDTQVLTANSSELLLNGIPLATISNLSSIADWSLSPQISTLNGNNQDIKGTNLLQAKTIGVSTLGVSNATITTLVGNNGTFVNLFTQNLMAFNIVNFTSTVIDVYESTIQSDIKLANISTANICNLTANNANFDVLIVSSIASINSTINTAFLNVGSNANIQTATFSNGANFNGARPNFNTGINTTGPNNFNNCNIDNASNITGAIINLTVGGQTNITADAGANILGNPAINLTTQGGGTSAIRIYANQCSAFAFPIPTSIIDIIAEGNVSYIPIAPVPYGGTITMRAKAGGANPLTNPLSVLAGNGAIRLQADSYFSFGSLVPPVPGVIGLAGGAVLAYSGLTTPITGPYGCSFYSALTCLSLTCGLSPALTSFPGTVYLRGDNGTKVLNGLYVDTLYNSIGVDLNITSQSGNWVNIDKAQSIRMSNSGLLDGGGAGSRISNVETITASNINVANISTNAITLPQLYTSHINIAPSNTEYISAPDLTINANAVIDEGEDPLPNSLNLLASANINITIPNNNAYSINMSGNVYVSKNLYTTSNVFANTAVIGTPSAFGSNFAYFGHNSLASNGSEYALLHEFNGTTFLNCASGRLLRFRQNNIDIFTADSGGIYMNTNMNMCNNSISNINDLYFYNGAYIDGAYSNQLNFNASNSYFLGDLRFFGSNRVLDMASNDISRVKNMGFEGSNGYINNLEHIYGSTTAPAGGLAIDYMYGMFFNSAGRNANLYADANNLNMINYNSGINIANYNSNGTGNVSLFSLSNDVYVATGPGRDVNINGGRYVSVNSAEPNGAFLVYTSTMNTTTLLDTNITANRNMTLNSSSNINTNSVIDTNITAQKNMVLSASNSGNYITLNSGQVNRTLLGVGVAQPVIQYGIVSTSGNNGSIVVNIPNAYTSVSTYIALVSMEDTSPAQMSVQKINASRIEIYWGNAGGGSHSIAWSCQGE
jgi:hypothetical protein